jgi:hypothetical protein
MTRSIHLLTRTNLLYVQSGRNNPRSIHDDGSATVQKPGHGLTQSSYVPIIITRGYLT